MALPRRTRPLVTRTLAKKNSDLSLDERIASGEFDDSGSTKEKMTRPIRKALAKEPLGIGRVLSMWLAKLCLLYTSPSPRDVEESRMPSSA